MIRLLVAAALALAGCVGPVASGPARYANPVLDDNFPDPAVLRAPDGFYYSYATQGEVDGRMQNIQAARSRDLVNWERTGDALPVKPGWARETQDFWAPDVVHRDGRYFLYYSAKPDAALTDPDRGLCLAVATAERPEGPFTDSGRPLQCGEGFVNIDPFAYDDPATGKRLLYWGSGFGPIKVQELAEDRVSFLPGSRPIDLVHVIRDEDPANYQRLVEGAWIVRREGWYYLFYSGDNCCGPNAHYAVMVARSRSATGPFETLAEATGAADSVILERRGRWIAPGHNSVVEDAAGDHWLLYHAVDARRPRSRASDEVNSRRVMLLDRIVWRDGWPRVAGNGPSTGPRGAPAVR
ncbi:MAG: glycoside hydrolase family 43 protein [Allosphingosinicella sp.]|uniref:glycoside hydrolase family 43 protein n=1 Tax=Allosphingosinicella sp. TaxID=2823234 RepID=UPI00393D5E69